MNPHALVSWRLSLLVALPQVAIGGALLLIGCGSNGTKSGQSQSSSSSGGTGGGSDPGSSTCTTTADPGELVQVPAGDFTMGCNADVDSACADDEKPMHVVTLSAFAIDKTEVTQAQYSACVVASACDAPSCAWNF